MTTRLSTVLKLSEAIRKGSEMVPQCKGRYVLFGCDSAGREVPTHSCAIGAAVMAVTGTDSAAVRTGLGKATPREWLDAIEAMQDYFGFGPIMANDDFGWTREEIADKLDELGY